MSLALQEWAGVAKKIGVKACEIKWAMAMIDPEFKGTMTDLQLAEQLAGEPEFAQNIRQAIFEANLGCEDAPTVSQNVSLESARKVMLAKDPFIAAVNKGAIGKGLKGGAKSTAWKVAEFYVAKTAAKDTQKQVIETTKKTVEQKTGAAPNYLLLGGAALLLVLLLRS